MKGTDRKWFDGETSIEPGDWVYCVSVNSAYCGWLGYVEWVRPPVGMVQFTLNHDEKPVRKRKQMLLRQLALVDQWELTRENIDDMVNIALDTSDQEWFEQLITMRNEKEREEQKWRK
ncbi:MULTISPECIES: hypothetical protein [unclassified Geobacillus]|nr:MULTISPECIES: hypothetical protein [unclassified Geobacillus]ABO68191.1 Putative phage protein [Geobacillus thermodenitrificans NG80-2]